MKTPMQELIKMLKWRLSSLKEVQATAYPEVKIMLEAQIEELEMCIVSAELMLEKEREVMCQFAKIWDNELDEFKVRSAEDCFDKTFNTKEK